MAIKIYTKTGDEGMTSLIGGTKVPKSNARIEAYGTVDELNSFIGLLTDQLILATAPISTLTAPSSGPAQPNSSLTAPPPASAQQSSALTTSPPDPVQQSSALTTSPPDPADSAVPASSSPATSVSSSPSSPLSPAISSLSSETTPFLREIQDRLFTIGSSLACDPEKEPRLKIPDLIGEDVQKVEAEIDRLTAVLPPMKSFLLPGGHIAVSTAHVARCVCRRAERGCVRLQEEQLFVEPLVLRYLNRLSDYLFVLARYTAHLLQVAEIPWQPRT